MMKDICRANLSRFLIRAISKIPETERSLILDIGCGTGVPTLVLSNHLNGIIHAIDSDETLLRELDKKILKFGLTKRIFTFHKSVLEIDLPSQLYDIVLAEGLLNVIGFEKGLQIVNKIIKDDGYFIIHDEFAKHEEKLILIDNYKYKIIDSFIIDEKTWWNDYYKCLEEEIALTDDTNKSDIYENELKDIESYKKQPQLFCSIYYVLQKRQFR